jgi:superfamily II DNA or RNA helicase
MRIQRPRPYQEEFIDKSLAAWNDFDRILGVAATGAGKTIIASEIMRRMAGERCLFMADATELIKQNADKFHKLTGEFAAIEQAEFKASLDARVVIASSQSLARRFQKYPRDHFQRVIIDEAHRNTLGGMSQKILAHFESAKMLGVTATPFRSDKKELGSFYQHEACNINLMRLIREGWLSKITVKSEPLPVDLRGVKTSRIGGEADFALGDLGAAIEPHLLQAALLLKRHAADRKTVAFLPLRETSRKFVDACNSIGLRACHVDGDDRDAMHAFARGEFQVICNASLLTTGWDCPTVDCIFILRPTKSLALYMQMVGRGTRPLYALDFDPNADFADMAGRLDARDRGPKYDMLLLDPLFLADDNNLIRPTQLIHANPETAAAMEELIKDGGGDLLELQEKAESTVAAEREEALKKALAAKARKKARTIDLVEFCLSLNESDAANFTPQATWEAEPASEKQLALLDKFGFDVEQVTCRGQASALIGLCIARNEAGLATPGQVQAMRSYGHPSPDLCTRDEAKRFIERMQMMGTKPTEPAPLARPAAPPPAEKSEAPASTAPAPARWTSVAGRTVDGTPLSLKGGTVEMRTADNRFINLPLARFMPADRDRLAAIFSSLRS